MQISTYKDCTRLLFIIYLVLFTDALEKYIDQIFLVCARA